ncbi:hypothetical protein J4050_14310 [Winogradskyella sp. DF17]|uniref:Lipoprotein n=1 Tax=Winogradskyella pelagia TaxID=2819984 RepID=A0ABS3T7Q3_9FLAO|nr:hypothetical protein [Winogradskyella sp. DF17]MBO3117926.1 hypothetical protein [Winogradskyella sp. DF17]
MKKIIISSALILFFLSCESIFQLKPDQTIEERIMDEINREDMVFDLSTLSSFEWDSVIILGPYTIVEDTEKLFDLNLSNISRNGIEYSDSYNLLVFLRGKKSVKITEVNLSLGPVRKIFEKEKLRIRKEQNNYILFN